MNRPFTETELINNIISILKTNPKTASRYKADIERFEERKRYAEEDTFRLGVIGITSCGKSTLINSLLGEALLPVEARPTSSQLVSCRKGNTRRATVFFKNEKSMQVDGARLTPSLIKRYGDESINNNNKENVKEIHVESPAFPFERRLVLVDSPGLDAYGFSAHEELTMHTLLPTIDFCLYIITCKDYPEQKLHEVLNTIADYNKPVIVIQNMIDSVLESPDRSKSRQTILNEHENRLKGIISRTNLSRQPLVSIVQFSSQQALEGRRNHDQHLLKESRYDNLILAVNQIFNQIKPSLIGNRLSLLKKEIHRLVSEAQQDASQSKLPIAKFPYETLMSRFEKIGEDFNEKVSDYLSSITDKKLSLPQYLIESDMEGVNTFEKEIVKEVSELLKKSNAKIAALAEELNVNIRDLVVTTRISAGYDIALKKKPKKIDVPKPGFLNKIGRGIGLWGTEEKTISVTDYDASRNSILSKLNNFENRINSVSESWSSYANTVYDRLELEVKNRRRAYDARVNERLESKVYDTIAQQLSSLENSIIIPKAANYSRPSFSNTAAGVKKSSVSKLSVSIYDLAKKQLNRIQEATIKCLLNRKPHCKENIIIGWDKYSLSSVAHHFFNSMVMPERITNGLSCLSMSKGLYIVCDPSQSLLEKHKAISKNVFILVDPTQSGSALTQLNKIRWNEVTTQNDNLFFVIENFEKSINGNSVEEVLGILKMIGKDIRLNRPYMVLINHGNPIYNIVAAELQLNTQTLHFDETQIIKNLQEHFHSLYTRDTRTNIQLIIRNLKRK